MRLTFLGHAAFLIETGGKKILTDPYSREIGYLPVGQSADYVSLSHQNPRWHSCLDEVSGQFEVLNGLDLVENQASRGEIRFGAVRAFETAGEGENAMVWIESEGLRVLHMGDCGLLPDDATIGQCGRVDVLLALVGGSPTLNLEDLMIFIRKLAPKLVIPMHYGVPNLQMSALDVVEIIARFQNFLVVRRDGASLEIGRETLPDPMQLHVLRPLRQI